MKHKHDHCKHENLKYCEHCKVVHCLDCEQEFPEKQIVIQEKIVYKERNPWTYPSVTWGAGQEKDVQVINAVSNKTVYDKDRFTDKAKELLSCCILD